MVKKITKYLKFVVCCALIISLIAPSYAALSASDGSAFVTKAEFDAALADFNSRLTTFEAGINSKIDSQVTSYLDRNGIWNGKDQLDDNLKKWRWNSMLFTTPSSTSANLVVTNVFDSLELTMTKSGMLILAVDYKVGGVLDEPGYPRGSYARYYLAGNTGQTASTQFVRYFGQLRNTLYDVESSNMLMTCNYQSMSMLPPPSSTSNPFLFFSLWSGRNVGFCFVNKGQTVKLNWEMEMALNNATAWGVWAGKTWDCGSMSSGGWTNMPAAEFVAGYYPPSVADGEGGMLWRYSQLVVY